MEKTNKYIQGINTLKKFNENYNLLFNDTSTKFVQDRYKNVGIDYIPFHEKENFTKYSISLNDARNFNDRLTKTSTDTYSFFEFSLTPNIEYFCFSKASAFTNIIGVSFNDEKISDYTSNGYFEKYKNSMMYIDSSFQVWSRGTALASLPINYNYVTFDVNFFNKIQFNYLTNNVSFYFRNETTPRISLNVSPNNGVYACTVITNSTLTDFNCFIKMKQIDFEYIESPITQVQSQLNGLVEKYTINRLLYYRKRKSYGAGILINRYIGNVYGNCIGIGATTLDPSTFTDYDQLIEHSKQNGFYVSSITESEPVYLYGNIIYTISGGDWKSNSRDGTYKDAILFILNETTFQIYKKVDGINYTNLKFSFSTTGKETYPYIILKNNYRVNCTFIG